MADEKYTASAIVFYCRQLVCEMAKTLLDPVSEKKLYRLHLWGGGRMANNGGGGMDEYIGRTAHVSSGVVAPLGKRIRRKQHTLARLFVGVTI